MADGVIGATAGNYRILSKISDGGMGTVYRAEHVLIGRAVAVKVLQPELTTNREIVSRFFNEAKATTAIKHPGIVEVFDFGYLENGLAYIVMELLEGMTLARRAKMVGAMNEGEAAALLRAVCSALAAAHDKGIVHRDLKPDNIFLVPDLESPSGERPKLLDFGIAKLTDIGSASAATKTGAVMGTPTYMSPEQCRGSGEVDHRADLYSLGCIYYQLVAGRPPFASQGAGEVIGMHLFMQPDPPSLHHPGISPNTEALIMRLLAKDPAHRPQSARELATQLQMLAHSHGWISASSPPSAWSQSEMPMAPTPSFTPAYTPTRPGTAPPPPSVAAANQPTTLSGAASQSMVGKPKSRVGLGIAIALVGAAAIVGVALGVSGHGGDEPATKQPAAAAAPAPTPAPAPIPAPTPPPVVVAPPPTPTPPPPVVVVAPTPTPAPIAKTTKKPAKPEAKPPVKKPDATKPDLPIETSVE